MMKYTYNQLAHFYKQCHTLPVDSKLVYEWANELLVKLGPDDCKGFLIRSYDLHLKGMFLCELGRWAWVPHPSEATLFDWGQTASKCTNNKKLEAIRVGWNNIATDSKGVSYIL